MLGVYGGKPTLPTQNSHQVQPLDRRQLGCGTECRSQWKISGCEELLGVYTVRSYGINDTLPGYITTPILSPPDLESLAVITENVLHHLKKLGHSSRDDVRNSIRNATFWAHNAMGRRH